MKNIYTIKNCGKTYTLTIEGENPEFFKAFLVNCMYEAADLSRKNGYDGAADYVMDVPRQIWEQDRRSQIWEHDMRRQNEDA